MKKNPEEARNAYQWSNQPNHKKKPRRIQTSSREKSEKEQSEEEMIRSLQGVFCKGRYRSWVFSQGRS